MKKFDFNNTDIINKHIFILSHHRSGSSWFTRGFKNHFNLQEFFNPAFSIEKIFENRISYSLPKLNSLNELTDEFINNRKNIFYNLSSKHKVISKTHSYILKNVKIKNFLKDQSNDKEKNTFIMIERRNKLNAFISAIIAFQTKTWCLYSNKTHINKLPLNIDLDNIDRAIIVMNDFFNRKQDIIDMYDPFIIYYEDLLNQIETNVWSPNVSHIIDNKNVNMKIQNDKNRYNIINKDQIINYIIDKDITLKNELIEYFLRN